MTQANPLANYRLLGKTGLRVSPLAFGAMTFGWGADKEQSRGLFERYLEAGGNFIDTADVYTEQQSEAFLGEFITATKTRDRVVLASKYSFSADSSNPNAGGNGRKNLRRALDGSLKRLKTDYIDLYWVHAWDGVTPVEEVMTTLNDLVRQGKLLHIGLSDVPAWYAARAQTLAERENLEPVAALQLEYSLISRNLEREHLPMAKELGISLIPWSPLASGFLAGKYRRTEQGIVGEGRVQEVKNSGNPVLEKFAKDERNWTILETLVAVAHELGRTPAEVALNWVATQAGVCSTLIGATKISQLDANLNALSFTIPSALRQKLDEASKPKSNELDHFFEPVLRSMINGKAAVTRV